MATRSVSSLTTLARLYGVQTAYYGFDRRRRQASPEALLAVLRALGAPLERTADAPSAVRHRNQELWRRCVEPVAVAWEGHLPSLELRLPKAASDTTVRGTLELEGGGALELNGKARSRGPKQTADVEGELYVTNDFTLPAPLPMGYHRLTLEVNGGPHETTIISTPRRAFTDTTTGRTWGAFLPLYALHSGRSWGAGDFTDLEAFMEWVAALGGGVVGTLPIVASFLDEPFDPSPYSPASRLQWNEFYVDVSRLPELKRCPEAQSLLDSDEMRKEQEALRSSPLVDYRRQMALKRRVLEALSRSFFTDSNERREAFEGFLRAYPSVEEYARFRAVGERRGRPWPEWPEALRQGPLPSEAYDEGVERYYLYAQWLAHEQILSLAEQARSFGPGLYLDFPLGVHPHGYDTWRERDTFAPGVSVGAPPDSFFTKGQNWGFPPLCPQMMRTHRYRYLIDSLRHHLRAAGILRIDHVMALHRLFWIPTGLDAREGVYVRYNPEELYAVVCLESHRHKSWIVGENLGTVPYYVNPTMSRHDIFGMYVLQYELNSDLPRPVRAVGQTSVASLNTHDMPTFAAFWQGLDVDQRQELGLLDAAGVRRESKRREAIKGALVRYLQRHGRLPEAPSMEATLRACVAHLGESRARVVLVNLEDLWLEERPQNVPGTHLERPNWRRKAIHGLEDFRTMPSVQETFQELDHLRKGGGKIR